MLELIEAMVVGSNMNQVRKEREKRREKDKEENKKSKTNNGPFGC